MEPDPYIALTDPDPEGPKTYGSYGSGSPTLNLGIYILQPDRTAGEARPGGAAVAASLRVGQHEP
jgi:hypothetical protein